MKFLFYSRINYHKGIKELIEATILVNSLGYQKYFELLQNNKTVIKGLRKNRKIFDNFFTFCMSAIASIIFFRLINDINAQPKIFARSPLFIPP